MSYCKPLKVLIFAILFAQGFTKATAAGEAKSSASGKAKAGASVLDFESDVIEGQRKKPDLFMQSGSQNLTLDAILFLRNDFNDLQQIEINRKPGYFDKKGR